MRRLLLGAALVASGSLCAGAWAHGGTYIGPGDTVPPGGGGGGGGGGTPSAGGPSTAGPTGPSHPGSGGTPGSVPGLNSPPGASTSGGGDAGPDLTLWQYWWGFNQAPYLRLRDAIHQRVVTGSDDFWLGHGQRRGGNDSLAPSEAVIRGTIVPALRHALRSERQNDILDACLIALAKIGDSQAEDGSEPLANDIKRFLSHSSAQLSETAAVSLGILASDSADTVAILLALLQDDAVGLREHDVRIGGAVPVRTRAFATYGLGLIGSRAGEESRLRINAALAALLEGEGKQMGTRDVQVAAVISMGLTPLALDPTSAAVELRDADEATGWPLPERIEDRRAQVSFLMNYFEDTETNNFLIAAHAPMAVARLVRDLSPEHPLRAQVARRFLRETGRHSKAAREIQQSCVQALGAIGDCDGDPVDVAIRAALMEVGDELVDPQCRRFALIALGQACGRPGQGAGDALAGLAAEKGGPRAYLLTQLARAQAGVRPWAALGLAVLERSLADAKRGASPDSLAALRDALRDARSPDEVGGYAIALGIARDPAAGPHVLAQLERASTPEARGYCAVGLGLLDHDAAIEPISALIERSKYQPDLLKSAAIALGLLGDQQVVDVLVDMLGEAAGLSSQAAIASALGIIGDHRSVDPLVALLGDQEKTALARGFAAAALGLVADKEALPWNSRVSVDINYRANTTTLTSPDDGTGILDLL